ncbi:MAG: glycosyltransferase [Acidimicrobiia bacterium]
MKPIKLKPIINFAAVDFWYHNRAHSEIQLMTRLSKYTKVLFINSIGMRAPIPGRSTNSAFRIWRKIKSLFRGLKKPIAEYQNFYVFTPIIIPAYSSPKIRKINFLLIFLQVRTVMYILKIKNPIIFETIPTSNEIAPKLKPLFEVVNRVDKMSAFKETNQSYIKSLEESQISRALRTYYTSQILLEEESNLHNNKGDFLDHGVDTTLFKVADNFNIKPSEFKNKDRKIIGFFGGLDDYVIDFELLEKIITKFDNVQIVLIGEATCDISQLLAHENVTYLGFLPVDQVAKLGAYFDVGILPRRNDEWTKYTNPIKIKEYLSLGLEIVSMNIKEIQKYKDEIYLCENYEEFLSNISLALEKDSTIERRKYLASLVRNDTWDIRSDEVLEDLRKLQACVE